jgi:hypothetical protein
MGAGVILEVCALETVLWSETEIRRRQRVGTRKHKTARNWLLF